MFTLISAKGTFVIHWGDGEVQVINRSNTTTETVYTHKYARAGGYKIGINGTATGYNTSETTAAISFTTGTIGGESRTPTLIEAIVGHLGTVFPTLGASNGVL